MRIDLPQSTAEPRKDWILLPRKWKWVSRRGGRENPKEEKYFERPKYIIGIDLGTTHSVLAYTELTSLKTRNQKSAFFRSPSCESNEIQSQALLPSFVFLPGPHDVPQGSLALPWDSGMDVAVGEFARKRGAEIPNRLISSAKSWLSHSGVARTAPILPWDAPPDARRMSPVEASAMFLKHLRDAWNHEMATDDADARFELQEIYLTVPASFDAVARELTVKPPSPRVFRMQPCWKSPGGLIRMDRVPQGPVAKGRPCGGIHPGVRSRRRDNGLQPHPGHGRRRGAGFTPRGRG